MNSSGNRKKMLYVITYIDNNFFKFLLLKVVLKLFNHRLYLVLIQPASALRFSFVKQIRAWFHIPTNVQMSSAKDHLGFI